MIDLSIFTALDVLAADTREPADPYAAQLLHSYHALYQTILREEHQVRQFTQREYQTISAFLAGHNGNPLGFALRTALREDANEALSFCAPVTAQILVEDIDEPDGSFLGIPWSPLNDPELHASYHDHRANRFWSFRMPLKYGHTLVFQEEGQERRVMYHPNAWKNTLLPGVFFPYDLTYMHIPPQSLTNQDYLIKMHRRESPGGYPLNLGSFVRFALECFPVLCPQYQIPSFEEDGEHLLELYLRAYYGKRFRADRTTFQAEGERGIRHGLPQWAQRWMVLWHELPAGIPFGKEEVLAVLDCLWNTL